MAGQKFKTTITSKHRLFDLHLRETFKYRDLIWLFVKRDFTALYKQTILGPLWAVIQPLLTTFVFSFIFGSLAGLTTADVSGSFNVPSFLFYMAGTMLFTYFSTNVNKVSKIFIENRQTMGKVYYPRLVQPIAASLSNLIPLLINLVLYLIVWIVFLCTGTTDMQATWWLLFIPLVILQLIILSMGLGLIISAVTTKYRDLQMLVGFGLQLWQYASPIAYGLTLITASHPELELVYTCVNPLTPIVTTFRYAMFGFGYFNYIPYLVGWGISIFVFFIGLLIFSKTEKNFMDTI